MKITKMMSFTILLISILHNKYDIFSNTGGKGQVGALNRDVQVTIIWLVAVLTRITDVLKRLVDKYTTLSYGMLGKKGLIVKLNHRTIKDFQIHLHQV